MTTATTTPASAPASVAGMTQRYYRRFTGIERVMHAALMLTFVGCALSGLPLIYSDQAWARTLARLLGGFEGAEHRVVARQDRLVEARQQLLLALAGGDEPEVRAGAILALAMEEQITQLFLDKLRGTRNPLLGAEEERLREVQSLVDALIAGASDAGAEARAARTLMLAREVHAALRERGFTRGRNLKAAAARLKLFQPRWKVLLDSLAASVSE